MRLSHGPNVVTSDPAAQVGIDPADVFIRAPEALGQQILSDVVDISQKWKTTQINAPA